MIVIKCTTCGKKLVWDDFQSPDVSCPGCGERLNVHAGLKENLVERDRIEGKKIKHCSHCNGIVNRRWFFRCPHCKYLLFGPVSFHGNWPFILGLALIYLMFTIYYVIYIR
mgnify:CR=1 FL=1